MKYSFIEYLRLTEAVKERQFNIEINADIYLVSREPHIFDKRGNDKKPRDFKMSKSKYQHVFETFMNSHHYINLKKPVTITWEDETGKMNALSANINSLTKIIAVFGAIMNASKDHNTLYSDIKNRYHLGKLKGTK